MDDTICCIYMKQCCVYLVFIYGSGILQCQIKQCYRYLVPVFLNLLWTILETVWISMLNKWRCFSGILSLHNFAQVFCLLEDKLVLFSSHQSNTICNNSHLMPVVAATNFHGLSPYETTAPPPFHFQLSRSMSIIIKFVNFGIPKGIKLV